MIDGALPGLRLRAVPIEPLYDAKRCSCVHLVRHVVHDAVCRADLLQPAEAVVPPAIHHAVHVVGEHERAQSGMKTDVVLLGALVESPRVDALGIPFGVADRAPVAGTVPKRRLLDDAGRAVRIVDSKLVTASPLTNHLPR